MKAILTEARPANRNEAKQGIILPAGTRVNVTKMNNGNGRMVGEYQGWTLNFGQDEAIPMHYSEELGWVTIPE